MNLKNFYLKIICLCLIFLTTLNVNWSFADDEEDDEEEDEEYFDFDPLDYLEYREDHDSWFDACPDWLQAWEHNGFR